MSACGARDSTTLFHRPTERASFCRACDAPIEVFRFSRRLLRPTVSPGGEILRLLRLLRRGGLGRPADVSGSTHRGPGSPFDRIVNYAIRRGNPPGRVAMPSEDTDTLVGAQTRVSVPLKPHLRFNCQRAIRRSSREPGRTERPIDLPDSTRRRYWEPYHRGQKLPRLTLICSWIAVYCGNYACRVGNGIREGYSGAGVVPACIASRFY